MGDAVDADAGTGAHEPQHDAAHAPHLRHDGSVHTIHARLAAAGDAIDDDDDGGDDTGKPPGHAGGSADDGQPQLARVFFDSYVRGAGYIVGVFIAQRILSREHVVLLLLVLPAAMYAVGRARAALARGGAVAAAAARLRLDGFVAVWRDMAALVWGTLTWLHLSALKFALALVWTRHANARAELLKLPLLVIALVALRHGGRRRKPNGPPREGAATGADAARLYATPLGHELVDEYIYGVGFVVGTTLAAALVPAASRSAVVYAALFGALYYVARRAEALLGEARNRGGPLGAWLAVQLDVCSALAATLMWMLLRAAEVALSDARLASLVHGGDVVRLLLALFVAAALTQPRDDPTRPNSFVNSLFSGFGFVLGSALGVEASSDPKLLPRVLFASTLALVAAVRAFAWLRDALRRRSEAERRFAVALFALVEVVQATVLWYHLVVVQRVLDEAWLGRIGAWQEAVRVPLVVLAVIAIATRPAPSQGGSGVPPL